MIATLIRTWSSYIMMALGATIVVLLITLYFKNLSIDSLKEDVVSLGKDVAICEASKQSLLGALNKQNVEIESIRIDYDKKIAEYKKIKTKVKIKYVDRYIKDVKKDKGECENVKSILSSVRKLGFP